MERRCQALGQREAAVEAELERLRSGVSSREEAARSHAAAFALLKRLRAAAASAVEWAEEAEDEAAGRRAAEAFAAHAKAADGLQTELRRANVVCKRRLEAHARELLLAGAADRVRQRRAAREGSAREENARAVTESFGRTKQMLAVELARSKAARDQLREGTNEMERANDTNASMSAATKTGSSIVRRLRNRERTDKMLIAAGVAFFLLVVLYIVKKRLSASFLNPFGWL